MSSWWNPSHVLLAISVGTAILCFALLVINVDRMKLSRNALDLVVVRFKKELTSTIAQVAAEKDYGIQQRVEKERVWRMLETINLCRPMYRDHALASALADYEAETIPLIAPVAATSDGSSPSLHSRALESKSTHNNEEVKAPKPRPASALAIYQQLCSSIQINGPTPDIVARDVKLEHLLFHPVTLELFKDAMVKEHCAENIMFFLDIRRYKVSS
jgi:hypothetical protein